VGHEQIARFAAETGVRLAHLAAKLTHEVISEEQDIVAPFAASGWRGSQMGRPCRTGEGQQGRAPPSGVYFFFFLVAFFFFTDSPPSRRMLSAC
jgi:hypothetical protein